MLVLSQMSNDVCLLQKRKVETVPLATQVSPATPVPSLPSSAEASQASVFPAVRETNTFKSREDHEQISSLTTVKETILDPLNVWVDVFFSPANAKFLFNNRTALPDDSSPRSPGGRGKLTAGELTKYVTSVYFIFAVNLLLSHFRCLPHVGVFASV